MTASLILIVIMGALFAAGVYAMLERSLTRVLIGFLLLGNAANMFLLIVMGRPGIAPFFGDGDPEDMSDGKLHLRCLAHCPDDIVIYDPVTQKCRDKSGDNVWDGTTPQMGAFDE